MVVMLMITLLNMRAETIKKNMKCQKSERIVGDCPGYVLLSRTVLKHLVRKFTSLVVFIKHLLLLNVQVHHPVEEFLRGFRKFLHIPGSVVYVSIARISPSEDDRLNVQRFSSWVGNGHVHNPFYLVAVLQLTVWPQPLHHHVQGPGPRERHVLQQRQVILLSELV